MATPTSNDTLGSLKASSSTPATSQGMPFNSKKFIGAVKDDWELFSDCADDYTIGAPIGFGASSIVYSATYHPKSGASSTRTERPMPCALKVLDLDSLPPRSLALLQRETTLMSLSKHPNVLRVRGLWMDGHKLYIALRLMNKGSAADVMRYGWPGGMEEDVVRCILNQALLGLNYLHINGFIHRDIKAANLLMDEDGTVLLGDLGVAANLAEDTPNHSSTRSTQIHAASATDAWSHSRAQVESSTAKSGAVKRTTTFDAVDLTSSRPKFGKRKSFVGTPCWMAPELIQGKQYDSSVDIWSFGITALELTQGRPPKSRESSQKVLLKIIQEAPPTLDRESGSHKYSRAFKEIIDSCLVKDPSKRPTAQELLQTPFFKSSKNKSYLVGTILKSLPPLIHRQERRVTSHTQLHQSVDSWDFVTTVNSPTTGAHRRRVLEAMVIADEINQSVIDMSDAKGTTTPHSRSVSWNDGSDIENDDQGGAAPSSSLSDTDTPPSGSSPPSSIPESFPPAAGPLPGSVSGTMKADTPPHPPNLWSKIKTNVKRPNSSGGVAVMNLKRARTPPPSSSGNPLLAQPATQSVSKVPPTRRLTKKADSADHPKDMSTTGMISGYVLPTPVSSQSGFWNKIKTMRRPSSPTARTTRDVGLTHRKQEG